MDQPVEKITLGKKILYGILLYLGVTAGLVVILSAALWFKPPSLTDEAEGISAYTGASYEESDQGELIPVWAPTLGPEDADITIIEFGDFHCPFCKASFEPVRRLVNRYPDKIRLVYRHFPIVSLHPQARELAHASMCAHEQGKFWALHDRFFQFQDDLTTETLLDHARAVGLDMQKFQSCHSSRRWYDEIDQDLAAIVSRKGRGTPSWIVNGQLLQGYLSFESWVRVLDSLGIN